MRSTIIAAAIFTLIMVASFTAPIANNQAIVKPYNGLNVYILSTPFNEYTTLGTVKKTGLVMSGDAKNMLNTLIRRAKKEYPNCEGIIVDDISMETATVIKF
jgi:hypothetical protein